MHGPFVCIKIKTGETLFAEITEHNEDDLDVRRPMLVKTFQFDANREGMQLHNWVPYTDDEIFDIPLDIVYYVGELKEQFIKYYGSVIMREDLAKLRETGLEQIKRGASMTEVHKDILAQVKSLGEDYSIKYGLAPEPAPYIEEPEFDFDIGEEEDMAESRTLH